MKIEKPHLVNQRLLGQAEAGTQSRLMLTPCLESPPPNLAHSPAGISGESSILVTRPLSKFFRQLGEC